jgi:hypothetical protein
MASNAPQPPAPMAPPPAQPAPGAPQKKGTSPLIWILAGCGGLIVIAGIVFAIVAYWGVHKLKGVAESAKKNPAVFAAKLAVMANPELEIVASDDDAGTVTIRNKKTGEQITMNAQDIKQGRLKFKNEKGEEVTFEGSGEQGNEGLRIKSDKGTVTFGNAKGEKAPAWVPVYPGSRSLASASEKTAERTSGSLTFQVSDASDKVLAYYERELKSSGFTVEVTVTTGTIRVGSLSAKADSGRRTVNVIVTPTGAASQVAVQYALTGSGQE